MDHVEKRQLWRDFCRGQVLETLPSNARYVSLNCGPDTKIPHALWAKKGRKKQKMEAVAYSIKTSKRILKKKTGAYGNKNFGGISKGD